MLMRVMIYCPACCELIIDIAKLHYVYVLSEINNDDDDDDNYFVIANLLRLALYGKGIKQPVYLSVCRFLILSHSLDGVSLLKTRSIGDGTICRRPHAISGGEETSLCYMIPCLSI